MLVARQPTPVLFVAGEDELGAIRAAWERLEAVVPLRGRRFFGVFDPGAWYRACVERLPDEEAGELEAGVIPGGPYLRERLRGEPPGIYTELAAAFERLEALAQRDPSRPGIEHYRRRDEIDVLMPVHAE